MGLFKLTIIVLALLLPLVLAAPTPSAHQRILETRYDDGSEMAAAIIRDYLQGEECQQRCSRMGEAALRGSFEAFREGWVERMVNFVIGELKLDAESARSIRKNPASYMINYQTFKLLAFR